MRRLLPLLLYLIPLVSRAGPPFLTDDPDPIPYRTFEAIPFYALDRGSEGSMLTGLGMDFNYGIHPDMHLNLQPGFVREMPAGEAGAFGLADLRVALKWRFLQETDDRPEVAIYPAAVLPTGSAARGLGNGQVYYQFPVWLEKSWGEWTSYGGGGYTLNRAPGARDYFYGGWLLERKLSDRWFLGGEVYSQGASADGVPGYAALNFGGGYTLTEHAALIFSAGHSYAGASHAFGYLGVDFTWGG